MIPFYFERMKTFTFNECHLKTKCKKNPKIMHRYRHGFLQVHFLVIISSGIPLFTQNNWNTHTNTFTSLNLSIFLNTNLFVLQDRDAVAEINLFPMTFSQLNYYRYRKKVNRFLMLWNFEHSSSYHHYYVNCALAWNFR